MPNDILVSSEKRKQADVLFVGYFEKGTVFGPLKQTEPGFYEAVKSAAAKGRVTGKFGETFSHYSEKNQEAVEIILVGLGQAKKFKATCFRKTASRMIKTSKSLKAKTVRVYLDSFAGGAVSVSDAAGLFSEMTVLASYEFDRYKTKKAEKDKKDTDAVYQPVIFQKVKLKDAEKKSERHLAVAEAVVFARNLINEPANILNPQTLAKEAAALAKSKKLSCEIIQESELKKLKMGGILAVNQGSRVPAALIVLEHGKNYKNKGTVCLVGKGVTFDTGGISIKPAKDMEKMKYDMSGAAAVIASMGMIADLKIPLHVVGLAPAVENNVAENPQRPGDIIRMHNGKTVEVINTDAEGRLILGDALSYSEKYKPKAIIDFATLTGMCAYTFGDQAIGLLGNDSKLVARIKKAGESSGERCWELPLWEEYKEQIKGAHSDLYNVGGPYGGTITAAMFLKEFVPEKTAWAHLDIAGTAWCNSPRYDCPKGGTGVGVKLLAQLLSDWAK